MVSNAEELTSNLQALLSIHKQALDVLNAAKNITYIEIAKKIGIPATTVSTILNRAKGYGYVVRIEDKWKKTKEIKGNNLHRMAKVKFTESLNPRKGFAGAAVKTVNPLAPLNHYSAACEMAEGYKIIFCLENTLRDFIRDVFKNENDWIENRLDDPIKKDIERAKNEPYYAHPRNKDDLDYATLGHLFQIIISSRNWKDFLPRLHESQKSEFIATFKKILPSRHTVAHCIHLDKSNRSLLESRSREITMMFKL